MNTLGLYTEENAYNELTCCNICPRECNADRHVGPLGYCNTDAGFNISSICIHKGEEPVISGSDGICNVFFAHCNLQCIFCQNHQISQNGTKVVQNGTLEEIVHEIAQHLEKGIKIVGFVSASHMVPQMVTIIHALNKRGLNPVIVYNSNGYDKVETLQRLEGLVDVYLPDFKYADDRKALAFSGVSDYFSVASKALKEMVRQMGSKIHLDETGIVTRGIIVRHLVLPGGVEDSKKVLKYIAEDLSVKMSISLMAQYHPVDNVKKHPFLSRTITEKEYDEVVTEFYKLGFVNGWIQDIESNHEYLPDFNYEQPFNK